MAKSKIQFLATLALLILGSPAAAKDDACEASNQEAPLLHVDSFESGKLSYEIVNSGSKAIFVRKNGSHLAETTYSLRSDYKETYPGIVDPAREAHVAVNSNVDLSDRKDAWIELLPRQRIHEAVDLNDLFNQPEPAGLTAYSLVADLHYVPSPHLPRRISLNVTVISKDACGIAKRESHYLPMRKMAIPDICQRDEACRNGLEPTRSMLSWPLGLLNWFGVDIP